MEDGKKCKDCKHADENGFTCNAPGGACVGSGHPKWEKKNGVIPQPSKTLLDEFAMAAMGIMAVAMDQGYWTPGDDPNAEIAESSYQMAAAMMKERARRDEMGNVKEVK